MTSATGAPASRVDGPAKVRGEATYAAEFFLDGMLYGYAVGSPVARGRVRSVNTSGAMEVEGVVEVLTHLNCPRLSQHDEDWQDSVAPEGAPFKPLQEDRILFSQQPLALVLAETFEAARYAARLVTFEIDKEKHQADFDRALRSAYQPPESERPPDPRGEPEQAFERAAHKVEAEYVVPDEHHNPMEPHATLARWKDGKLTVWTKTQGVLNSRGFLAGIFGVERDKVEVLSPFVGGAFGSGLRPQYQCSLAAMAAKKLDRPVRVTLTRQQMFSFGHRPRTLQKLKLAADERGRLQALIHKGWSETSRFEHFCENLVTWGGSLYQCDNAAFSYELVPMDVYTPLDMRAPGGSTGVYALECAMDELAYEVGIDPLEFRLLNYAEVDNNSGLPYSSKELKEAYRRAAAAFGWSRRPMEPRSLREGDRLVGWGMASGLWEVQYSPASARAEVNSAGEVTVATASSDIGTGTYTILAQIASETLNVPLSRVTVKLGDTSLPQAPLEGGSMTAASVGTAVDKACRKLSEKLKNGARELAISLDGSPGRVVAGLNRDTLSVTAENEPDSQDEKFAKFAHSTSFVEVQVDQYTGTIKVSRIVTAAAAGKILNPKTAGSQMLGSAVWGVGMATHERSYLDQEYGRFINHNLAEYHIPVNADIPDIEVILVHEDDIEVNPLGVKGIGEVGMVGMAAAVGNAIFHATGKRIRKLPIQLDDLLN